MIEVKGLCKGYGKQGKFLLMEIQYMKTWKPRRKLVMWRIMLPCLEIIV